MDLRHAVGEEFRARSHFESQNFLFQSVKNFFFALHRTLVGGEELESPTYWMETSCADQLC
jgi:hypothetical protein